MTKPQGSVLPALAAAMAALVFVAPQAWGQAGMPDKPATASYKITKQVPLPGPNRWDFVEYSPTERRVYVAHGDRVSVVDEPTGKVTGEIGNLPGITHGIAISPETHQGFVTEGRPGLAVVFDLKSLKQTKTITTAPDADGILYEPTTKNVYVVNGDSGSLSVIDPSSDRNIATITVGSKLEPGVADGKGHIYVNGEEKNEIVAIDAKTNKVVAHWPMPTCHTPHGIAIDRSTRRLFSSCANNVLVVMNLDTGATVATLAIGAHTDGAAFDPVRKLVFSSNGDGTLSVIKEMSANQFVSVGTMHTKPGARTMSIDPKTGRIFLVAAEVARQSAASTTASQKRPTYAPNSVKLLYVDPEPAAAPPDVSGRQ